MRTSSTAAHLRLERLWKSAVRDETVPFAEAADDFEYVREHMLRIEEDNAFLREEKARAWGRVLDRESRIKHFAWWSAVWIVWGIGTVIWFKILVRG
jgi:hypothetical protein